MKVGIYLVSLEELSDQAFLEQFLRIAPALVDESRLRKAEKIISPRGRAVSLAAGLLLREAYLDFGRRQSDARTVFPGIRQLMGAGPEKIPEICTGENGKPYFVNSPLYFNLSHSGDYILCAVSDREVGADIQRREPFGEKRSFRKIAERFFSREETGAMEACKTPEEETALFYLLWTKKEAYGKLTGRGLPAVIGEDVRVNGELIWIQTPAPEGYEASVCIRKTGEQ